MSPSLLVLTIAVITVLPLAVLASWSRLNSPARLSEED